MSGAARRSRRPAWRDLRAGAAALAAALLLAARPGPLAGQSMDSLLAAAQRAARAWERSDFAGVVGRGEVSLQLPGGTRSAPLRPVQAVELLRSYTARAEEVSVEVMVAREVDGGRAYVEMERVYAVRGSPARRSQPVYLGFRRDGASYHVAEIRILP